MGGGSGGCLCRSMHLGFRCHGCRSARERSVRICAVLQVSSVFIRRDDSGNCDDAEARQEIVGHEKSTHQDKLTEIERFGIVE